jgi:hypothetical protein
LSRLKIVDAIAESGLRSGWITLAARNWRSPTADNVRSTED